MKLSQQDMERVRRHLTVIAESRSLKMTDALLKVIEYAPNIYARKERSADNMESDRRGMILVGAVGCGKTVALRIVSEVWLIPVLSAPDVVTTFATGGEDAFWNEVGLVAGKEIILDDLGAERDVQSYGNATPIGDWLCKRYSRWQLGGPATHVSTNLTPQAMRTRYGERVLDRIYEMMIPLTSEGGSLRRSE